MAFIPLGQIPRHQAEKHDHDAWAIRYGEDVVSWWDLETRSSRRAWALKDAGLAPGDLATVAVENGVAFFELMFALWKVGATPHVVSSRLPLAEAEEIIALARPKLLIASNDALVASAGAHPSNFGADFPNDAPLPEQVSEPWKAMSSGGSTGRPKIIVQPAPGGYDPTLNDILHIPVDGTVLTTGPLYHNMPVTTTITALCKGSRVVGLNKFDAEEALRLIEAWRVDWTSFVPTMMMRISRLPDTVRERYDLSSIKHIWHWASPMPPALKQEWIDRFGAEKIWEMYGGTEAIGTTILSGVEWLQHPGSVGRPLFDKVRILDEKSDDLAVGEIGEIFALPPTGQGSTYRYIGAEPRSSAGGYETLGDYGWLDEEGYLYIADRRTDMIVSGGANIFPAEVEGALMSHPSVEVAVVIGLPHEDLGARVHGIVKLAAGTPVEPDMSAALIKYLNGRLAQYKVPRSIEFTAEPLRDDAGKVRRQKLREDRLALSSLPNHASRAASDPGAGVCRTRSSATSTIMSSWPPTIRRRPSSTRIWRVSTP